MNSFAKTSTSLTSVSSIIENTHLNSSKSTTPNLIAKISPVKQSGPGHMKPSHLVPNRTHEHFSVNSSMPPMSNSPARQVIASQSNVHASQQQKHPNNSRPDQSQPNRTVSMSRPSGDSRPSVYQGARHAIPQRIETSMVGVNRISKPNKPDSSSAHVTREKV